MKLCCTLVFATAVCSIQADVIQAEEVSLHPRIDEVSLLQQDVKIQEATNGLLGNVDARIATHLSSRPQVHTRMDRMVGNRTREARGTNVSPTKMRRHTNRGLPIEVQLLHAAVAMVCLYACLPIRGDQGVLPIRSATSIFAVCVCFASLQYLLAPSDRCVPFFGLYGPGGALCAVLCGACLVLSLLMILADLARKQTSQQPRPILPKLPRIDPIDGLRMLTVGLIIFNHTYYEQRSETIFDPLRFLSQSEPLLFIVSGFILTHVTAQKTEHFNLASGAAFVARRLARLLPSYYLGSVLHILVQPSNSDPALFSVVTWFSQATLTQSLYPLGYCDGHENLAWDGNGVGWFLSAIVILCLCFPALFNVIRDFGSGVSLALLMLLTSVRVYAYVCTEEVDRLNSDYPHISMHMFAPWHFSAFLMGMLCSQLCRNATDFMRSRIWVLAFDGVFVSFIFCSIRPVSSPAGYFTQHIFDCLLCISAYGMATTAETSSGDGILAGLCDKGVVGNVLGSRIAVYLAQYSFSAYMLQHPVHDVLVGVFGAKAVSWWVGLPTLWAVSMVITPLIEKPAQTAMENWISQDRVQAKTSAEATQRSTGRV